MNTIFPGQNRKLSLNFTGPQQAIQLYNDNIVELCVKEKRTRVNSYRVKLFVAPQQLQTRNIKLNLNNEFVADSPSRGGLGG
jgi:hypothetical protein